MNNTNNTLVKVVKSMILYSFLLFSGTVFSQAVGINITKPSEIFHIDSKGDNSTTSSASLDQQLNDFIITPNGNIGLGTQNPQSKLHINATTTPVKLEGLTEGNVYNNNILVLDENNNVKKGQTMKAVPILNPTIFQLEYNIQDFLDNTIEGDARKIPMGMIKNTIDGLSYNQENATITFPKGTYQMTFTYQATHYTTCNLSSYFMDFPFRNTYTRIHTTSPHFTRGNYEHGGTITYVTNLPSLTNWQIKLGRGVSGNCTGKGMILQEIRTQLLVYRLGE